MEGQQKGKVRWSNKLISYSYLNMPIHTVKKVHEKDGGEKLRLGRGVTYRTNFEFSYISTFLKLL